VQVRLREAREICSPREILSQQAVGVLVAAALPRTAWIAEIDLHVGGDGEVLVVSHLLASIPGQGAAKICSGDHCHSGYFFDPTFDLPNETPEKSGYFFPPVRDCAAPSSPASAANRAIHRSQSHRRSL